MEGNNQEVAEWDLLAKNVDSYEYYLYDEGSIEQIFKGISFGVKRGELWGITGNDAYELMLFTSIISGNKVYKSGELTLTGKKLGGKRKIPLPDVFYIENFAMLLDNTTICDYLIYLTRHKNMTLEARTEMVKKTFEYLGSTKVFDLKVRFMTDQQKAISMILVGIFSPCPMIIFNIPSFRFNELGRSKMRLLLDLIRDMNKTFVMASVDCDFMERSMNHLVVIASGSVFIGETKVILANNCHDTMRVRGNDIAKIAAFASKFNDKFLVFFHNNRLFVISYEGGKTPLRTLYRKLSAYNFEIDNLRLCCPSIENLLIECEHIAKHTTLGNVNASKENVSVGDSDMKADGESVKL